MHEYLIDKEALGQFVDELFKHKSPSVTDEEQLNQLREDTITDLDNKIAAAIFGSFTKEQDQEYKQILNREDSTEQELEDFLDRNNIDIEQIATKVAEDFAKNYMKGEQDA